MKRTEEMNKEVDDFAKQLFGVTIDESIEAGLCIQCKEPAIAKCYSQAGVTEYTISGLCEMCFDAIGGADDEEIIETLQE
jgi:hypothetical protein